MDHNQHYIYVYMNIEKIKDFFPRKIRETKGEILHLWSKRKPTHKLLVY